MNSYIEAIACHLHDLVVTNDQLKLENPDWDMDAIALKTGVYQRHIASQHETAFDLAKVAVDNLFGHTKHQLKNLDGIIFCTQSADFILPQNSHLLHKYLRLDDAVFTFDLNLACSGFIYALSIADSFIKSYKAKSILIVTSDTYSKYIHPRNRSLRTLFGDGASAILLSSDSDIIGFNRFDLSTSGAGYDRFIIPAGGSREAIDNSSDFVYLDNFGNINSKNKIHMDGMAVWSFINSKVPQQINSHLEKIDKTMNQFDHVFFHQGSKFTLDSLNKVLNLNEATSHTNLSLIGNTVSSSIPFCIHNALENSNTANQIKAGHNVMLSGFGVGLSYGVTSFAYERECDAY
jgi:3-oxoacyl-[acyl-carrier-protein] synthase-3